MPRILFLLLYLTLGTASGSGLQVSPVSLTIGPDYTSQVLWLSNTGKTQLNAQIRTFRWNQIDNRDVLEPASDLIVSPPMVSVPPGEKQLVRVIRLGQPAGVEISWRLIIDELPVAALKRSGIDFILRYSIPVFLSPSTKESHRPEPDSYITNDSSGMWINIHNRGNIHIQISDIQLQDNVSLNLKPLLPGLVGYVLPGKKRAWRLPLTVRKIHPSSLKARINSEIEPSVLVNNVGVLSSPRQY
ncbi:molecular chaperone [Salmonella enterica]|nr:molecular chaperone [Salmonella enterica]EAX6581739.1 molecular chaperone [Salmonella enterica]